MDHDQLFATIETTLQAHIEDVNNYLAPRKLVYEKLSIEEAHVNKCVYAINGSYKVFAYIPATAIHCNLVDDEGASEPFDLRFTLELIHWDLESETEQLSDHPEPIKFHAKVAKKFGNLTNVSVAAIDTEDSCPVFDICEIDALNNPPNAHAYIIEKLVKQKRNDAVAKGLMKALELKK